MNNKKAVKKDFVVLLGITCAILTVLTGAIGNNPLITGTRAESSGTYHLSNETVKIWTNQDGSIDLLYNITVSLDAGDNMSSVTVGQPNGNYTIASATDQYGNPLLATDATEGSDYKVKVVLDIPLTAGQTVWFTLLTNVAGMMYNDTLNPGYWDMQFTPCSWPENVNDLQVTIIMPSWLGFNSSIIKASPDWNGTFIEGGRLAVFWERQNLLADEQFPVGISFPGPNPLSSQTGEVVLYEPTDDTYVDSNNQNSNYGSQDYLEVSRWTNSSQSQESIVWIKFSLNVVPDGVIVDDAKLQTYTSAVNETYNIQAYTCYDNSWSESTLTYANVPAYNATSMDSVLVATDNQWYNWSVTDAVRNALNSGSKAVTIVLRTTSPHNPASKIWFDSKECPVYPPYEYAPKLIIDYSGIVQVSISPSKTVVGQTYNCSLNVTLSNSGDSQDTFNVTLYANTTVIATQTVTNLSDGKSTVLVSTWSTAGFAYGKYTLWARAQPILGETKMTNSNCTYGYAIVTIPGDVDGNFRVQMGDVISLTKAFGSQVGQKKYTSNGDIDGNGRIDMVDIMTALENFGKQFR